MKRLIGATTISFDLPVDKALEAAKRTGADGVQTWNVGGPLDPANLPPASRKDFARRVADMGLVISALCGEIGGFTDRDGPGRKLEKSKEVIDLAADWGVTIVTGHIGVIPDAPDSSEWKIMHEALSKLGKYAEERGVVYGAETGPEAPALMRRFIETLPNRAIKINYDPANLVMRGFDPVAGVRELRELIVHTHVKDGVRRDGKIGEVPVGEGDVPWSAYLAALDEVGYRGFFAVEREGGADRVGDIQRAIRFIRSMS